MTDDDPLPRSATGRIPGWVRREADGAKVEPLPWRMSDWWLVPGGPPRRRVVAPSDVEGATVPDPLPTRLRMPRRVPIPQTTELPDVPYVLPVRQREVSHRVTPGARPRRRRRAGRATRVVLGVVLVALVVLCWLAGARPWE